MNRMMRRRRVGTRRGRRNQDLGCDVVEGAAVSGGGRLAGDGNASGRGREEEDGIAGGG